MAFVGKYDLKILPELGMIEIFKNGKHVKSFQEIAPIHFVQTFSNEN